MSREGSANFPIGHKPSGRMRIMCIYNEIHSTKLPKAKRNLLRILTDGVL